MLPDVPLARPGVASRTSDAQANGGPQLPAVRTRSLRKDGRCPIPMSITPCSPRTPRTRSTSPQTRARRRRGQVNHLRARLEDHIGAHPGYDLVKLRGSGSTAKHTAVIRRRRGEGSDADVAVYVRASSVGGVDADECGLLEWTRDRCIEVYGKTKDADDFVISEVAVTARMASSTIVLTAVPCTVIVVLRGAP